ncbi:hypothetical protein IMCC20628_02339 [Hoeflea sp. IMCC20628]|uniref:hypothetical protein n=1 Tax=Hoeflea sp. IMCC20628 TaxID=1620421 RepID=UPI00063BEF2F|nr:hypothetical protein [Hoeflea sp. IMCC20628]AKI01038.1 hypothetical protein IMCC20628_02339 [Hoeflea sp. IMCC20628]
MSMRLITSSIIAMAAATASFIAESDPAHAISRIETTKTDCHAIRGALIREGAAILRHTSKNGLPIYDRYVSSSLMCQSPEIGVWASVPARDTKSCRVIACDANASDDDLIRFRPLLRITP